MYLAPSVICREVIAARVIDPMMVRVAGTGTMPLQAVRGCGPGPVSLMNVTRSLEGAETAPVHEPTRSAVRASERAAHTGETSGCQSSAESDPTRENLRHRRLGDLLRLGCMWFGRQRAGGTTTARQNEQA